MAIGSPVIFHSAPLRDVTDSLHFWAPGTGRPTTGLPAETTMAPPELIAVSAVGQTLVAGARDGSVRVCDLRQPGASRRFFLSAEAQAYAALTEAARALHSAQPNYPEEVRALDLAPDGRTLALVGRTNRVTLWDVAAGRPLLALPEVQHRIRWVRFTPDGASLAWAVDGRVNLWDVRSACGMGSFGQPADSPSLCGAFSPNGRLLVSGTIEQGLRVWDLRTRQERKPLVGHLANVSAVAFAPDGRTLASGSADHTVRLWNVAAWQEVALLEGHQGTVTALAFSPDGGLLLSGSDALPGEILCWRAKE
jgi:WD40 repeat protein